MISCYLPQVNARGLWLWKTLSSPRSQGEFAGLNLGATKTWRSSWHSKDVQGFMQGQLPGADPVHTPHDGKVTDFSFYLPHQDRS